MKNILMSLIILVAIFLTVHTSIANVPVYAETTMEQFDSGEIELIQSKSGLTVTYSTGFYATIAGSTVQFDLIDANGNIVRKVSGSGSYLTMDIHSLASGTYTAIVSVDTFVYSEVIVLTK